jgi:hypothetical protein
LEATPNSTSFLIMTQENQPPADTDLLRDLEGLLQQKTADGQEVGGNIEIAAVRMQAVKEISETIRQSRKRKKSILKKMGMSKNDMEANMPVWEKGLEKYKSENSDGTGLRLAVAGLRETKLALDELNEIDQVISEQQQRLDKLLGLE